MYGKTVNKRENYTREDQKAPYAPIKTREKTGVSKLFSEWRVPQIFWELSLCE